MFNKISLGSVAVSSGLVLAFFKFSNFNPLVGVTFQGLLAFLALTLAAVYVSRIFFSMNKEQIKYTAVATLVVLVGLFIYGQGLLGISGAEKTASVGGTQSILGFVVEDVIGIPLWVLGLGVLAGVVFIFLNPLLAIGLFLILLAIVLFVVTPGFPFDEILSAGLGLLMVGKGVTGSKAPKGIPQNPPVQLIELRGGQ